VKKASLSKRAWAWLSDHALFRHGINRFQVISSRSIT